jgi:hypothetical protein
MKSGRRKADLIAISQIFSALNRSSAPGAASKSWVWASKSPFEDSLDDPPDEKAARRCRGTCGTGVTGRNGGTTNKQSAKVGSGLAAFATRNRI